MNLHSTPFRRFGHPLWVAPLLVGVFLVRPTSSPAAEPAFVGTLALAVEDEGVRRLGLSDEVLEELNRLIARRENEAVNLALSIKDLPPDERARRLAPFVAESERLGMALLTQQQRSLLHQLRLRRAGMVSLADSETAQLLDLDAEQRQVVARLMAERSKAMTQGGELQRRLTRDRFERQLRSVLSASQRAMWDQMAGITAGAVDTPDQTSWDPDEVAAAEGPAEGADSEPATAVDEPAAAESVAAETVAAQEPRSEPEQQDVPGDSPVDPVTVPDVTSDVPLEQPTVEEAKSPPSPSDIVASDPTPADAERPEEPSVLAETPRAPAPAERPVTPETDEPREVKLRFSFRFQPWEDVLDWLAEQADLSLQSSIIPEGTFNYSDPRAFTPDEAIDLINGVLLSQGYTLVRRGRLLTVMNLEDEVPDVLVEYVPLEKLDERGEYELVKTVFHLAKMEPSDAEQEIGQLLGPGRNMIVMPKSRQILVTETAGKLRTIRDVIERVENPRGFNGTAVSELKLAHVTPEEVLLIARPLMGLENNQNVGEDISIAIDVLGTRLFATGTREKVEILQDLVQRVDMPREATPAGVALEQPQLLTHPIQVADPAEALSVMQTLLAGLPDVRMSLDPKTNKIIALARPSEHRTIQETIKQLEGESPQFEVIPLKFLDPQLAVLTINNFLGTAGEGSSGIKIDADPVSRNLYVRATRTELDQIRNLLEKLDGTAEGLGARGNMRLIPLTGSNAVSAVEMAERLWRGPNRIQMTIPSDTGPGVFDLREITPLTPEANPTAPVPPPPGARSDGASRRAPEGARPAPPDDLPIGDRVTLESHDAGILAELVSGPMRLVSLSQDPAGDTQQEEAHDSPPAAGSSEALSETPPLPDLVEQAVAAARDANAGAGRGSDIRIEFTPGGILISSEDTEALDQFEEILRMVAGPQTLVPEKNFTVFFLKNCKAEVARQLVQDILGGTSSDGGGGSLLGDVASNLMGGGILGALLSGGGGDVGGVTTLQATGPVSIVADSRLNCLVVQALPADRQMIEEILKVIDREGSITDIQTAGRPRIIPVIYLQAQDVANMVREAYASRMSTGAQGGGQPNPADIIRALRGGRGGAGAQEVKSEEPKMTITVDARSNSLIVTAPEPLFMEVKELVEQLDQGGRGLGEEVQVVSLKKGNAEAVQKALTAIMGAAATSRQQTAAGPARGPGGPQGGASAEDIQRRVEFIQRLQQMGGQGGPGGMGGFGGRGGGGGAPVQGAPTGGQRGGGGGATGPRRGR